MLDGNETKISFLFKIKIGKMRAMLYLRLRAKINR